MKKDKQPISVHSHDDSLDTEISKQEDDLKTGKPRHIKFFIFLATVAIFVSLLIITNHFFTINKPGSKSNNQSSNNMELSRSLSSFETKYKNKKVTIEFTQSSPGWRVIPDNEKLYYIYQRENNSCKVTVRSTSDVQNSINSGLTLDTRMNMVLQQVQNGIDAKDLSFKLVSPLVINTNEDHIDFVRKEAEYTDNTGKNNKYQISAQWIGPNEYIITANCLDTDWNNSQQDISNLLNGIKININ